MSFISFSFLAFLPIVFLLYWLLSRSLRWQNLFLVIASYVFYGWWDYRFLILIIVTSFSSYVAGLFIESSTNARCRYWISASNILLNLFILGVFKYYNFFLDNLQALASSFGVSFDTPTLSLILPVGISFYTFQSLSYTIDVYRGKISATKDVVAFFAFICFFPQLVAGPIERATHLLPQMIKPRQFRYDEAVDGLRQMLWGFFKKMVVADNCALAVNQIWGQWQDENGLALLVGALLFTFQIYGDFSGYSDIAIGVSKLFGIQLNDNFRLPYFSRNISEFWRRWHISLMSWFRDYVYIPLGGSRVIRWKVARNVFVVFLLSGLWHGANWTFIVWGLYNALLFLPSILMGRKMRNDLLLPALSDIPKIVLVFVLVTIGWVIFRADNLSVAVGYLSRMMSWSVWSLGALSFGKTALLWCAVLVIVEWIQRARRHALQIPVAVPVVCRWFIYYMVLAFIIFFRGEEQTFIYFQF